MRRSIAFAVVMFIAQQRIAQAQGDHRPLIAKLPVGVVLRIWSDAPPMERQEARVIVNLPDSIQLGVEQAGGVYTRPVTLPHSTVQRVELLEPRPRASGALRGFGLGLLAAVAVDGLLVLTAPHDEGAIVNAFIGLLATPTLAIGGAVIGAVHPGERWAPYYER